MVLGMGVPELLVILLVALIIFGPKNLPKLGSAIGKTVKNVREGMEEGSDDKGVAKAEKSSSSENVEEVVADPDDADVEVSASAK
ncbi:twin-arginine translocase TatA/TatE family subunit [Olsenella sp. AM30-3LB]|mgnify:FL=1|uniref:twin-arginine translocase TatA/TatE family subunit n=1 Tax=Olsenella sp. AM30-3LB TaxID=2292359 RepID=UPI000E52BB5E|nr:twin-arginine translocase TatA/TatE family subunit [Olsenella sp. AM30-3LB]RHD76112.1 twin-arginine translocase TatA/TatE family subunit [Olsenella sp. AM30-3LB]